MDENDNTAAPDATSQESANGQSGEGRTFTQDDVNRFLAEEKRKLTSRFADYDEIREKAEQFDVLAAASQTDLERSVSEAAQQARWVAEAELMPKLVNAEFRAAAAGRIEADKLATILEPLDMAKFLTDDGEIDSAKVSAFVDGVAPAPVRPNGPSSSGLGNRGGEVRMTPKEQAAAQIAKRFPQAASK